MSGVSNKLCLIASSGGHIEELMQLEAVWKRYDRFIMVPKTKWTESLDGRKYFISDINRKNKFTKLFSSVFIFIEQFPIFLKEMPDLVITTGAAPALPMSVYAKLFGKRVVYIESIARVNSKSQTGKVIYKFADLFIVQWEEQLECYPNAVYAGWIY